MKKLFTYFFLNELYILHACFLIPFLTELKKKKSKQIFF